MVGTAVEKTRIFEPRFQNWKIVSHFHKYFTEFINPVIALHKQPLSTHCNINVKQECIPVGCVPAARRPYAGVCFPGGCLVGGVSGLGGMSAPRGCIWSGGCLVRGHVWSWGVSAQGGCIPACTEADPLSPCEQNE